MSRSVTPLETGSKVVIQSGVEISGPLAGLVENGATFVVKKLVAVFAERLAEKCGAGAQEEKT